MTSLALRTTWFESRSSWNQTYHPERTAIYCRAVIKFNLRPGTADNDANAENMGMIPTEQVNTLTDTDAFFIKTDAPNGFKFFNRSPIKPLAEGDFDTGNMRFKARERYSFGVSDWRAVWYSGAA